MRILEEARSAGLTVGQDEVQGRFKHLFAPENESLLQQAQTQVDAYWAALLKEEAFYAVSAGSTEQ